MIKVMGFKENLKSELEYSGMLVKELAAKSGVNKFSIDNYLNARGQIPSVEIAVRIAQALDVSVEYLVLGKEANQNKSFGSLDPDIHLLLKTLELVNNEDKKIIINNAIYLIKALANKSKETQN
ncbi:MAG: helix-turn-helix transcriptional regulator [Treponema sp.]|nr:helix-turn-helix transcriptional regulator [Treponema sp.]